MPSYIFEQLELIERLYGELDLGDILNWLDQSEHLRNKSINKFLKLEEKNIS